MAELNTGGGGGGGKKVRSKKQSTRVDLTAMVDLAFLLITFFMLTTSLSKPTAMDIAKPDKDEQHPENTMDFPASRTMTILLGKDGKLARYMGQAGDQPPVIESITQVRKALLEEKQNVAKANGNNPDKPFIVIIKPTSSAKYIDFVNMMDELHITDIKTVAIDDDHITDAEKGMMKEKGIL